MTDLQRHFVSHGGAARLLGVSRTMVDRYCERPDFPASVKIGRERLFRRDEVLAWKRVYRPKQGRKKCQPRTSPST